MNPKGQAVWPFEELHQRLAEYAYEVYDTINHPALGRLHVKRLNPVLR